MASVEGGKPMPEGNIDIEGKTPIRGVKPTAKGENSPFSLKEAARAAIERANISGVRQELATEAGAIEKGGPTFEAHIPVPHIPRKGRSPIRRESVSRPGKIIGPTPQEAEEFNKGLAKPSRWKNVAENKFARTAAALLGVGGTGIATYEAYQNIPAFHEKVDSVRKDVSSLLATATQGPESFANGTEILIGPRNTFPVPIETANIVLENMKRANMADETTLFFPLQLPEESILTYHFHETLKEFDSETGKNIMTDNKNLIWINNVPKGTNIIAPIDGIVYSYADVNGLLSGIGIEFVANGTTFRLGISGLTGDFIFQPNIDFPTLPEFARTGERVEIKRGQKIASLTTAQTLQLGFTSAPSGENGENPVPINFLTATDNAGREKLLVLGN